MVVLSSMFWPLLSRAAGLQRFIQHGSSPNSTAQIGQGGGGSTFDHYVGPLFSTSMLAGADKHLCKDRRTALEVSFGKTSSE